MTPTEALNKKNEGIVYFNLYGDMEKSKQKPKFKIGDKVRISKYKRKTFDKINKKYLQLIKYNTRILLLKKYRISIMKRYKAVFVSLNY